MNRIYNKHKKLTDSFVQNFQFRIFGLVSSFLIVLLINRFFGVATFGEYSLIFTISQACTLLVTFGIPNSLIKIIGIDNYNYRAAKKLLFKACKITFLFAIIPMLFFYLGANFLSTSIFKNINLYKYFLIISISIPLFVVHEIFVYFFIATKNFFRFNIFMFVVPNVLSIGLLFLFHFLKKDDYFTFLAFSLAIFFTVIAELFIVLEWKSNETHIKKQFSSDEMKKGVPDNQNLNTFSEEIIKVQSPKELLKTASPLFFSSFLMYLLNGTSIVILGLMVNEKELGVYNIVFKIANLGLLIIVSISTIITPKIAQLYGENNFLELKKTIQNATQLISILTIPLVITVIIFNKTILSFFSTEAVIGGNTLIIMILGVLLNAMAGNGDQILNMTNNQNILRNIILICFFFNVVLNVFLISFYGILGAAFASLFTNILLNIMCVYYIKKKLGFYTLF